MDNEMTFEEYIHGEVFNKHFETVFRTYLHHSGFSVDESNKAWSVFRDKLEPLDTLNELVHHFVLKEDLDNDIRKYEETFGLKNITLGKIYMDNLINIYRDTSSRCINSYKEYVESNLRKSIK